MSLKAAPFQAGGTGHAAANRHAQRFDPYRNFKFRLSWDGRCVAAASKMSGFDRKAITLERGVTHDPEFERWTHGVEAFDADPALLGFGLPVGA